MSRDETYGRWLADRRDAEPPLGFTDRVMATLERETPEVIRRSHRIADARWFHVVACAAASVVLILRLGCAYSLFIVF